MTLRLLPSFALLLAVSLSAQTGVPTTQAKPPLTLDTFMAETEYTSARLSPDGTAAVIATRGPDWMANRFREDLWLWRKSSGKLEPLTTSGHDSGPDWSPDGRFIAFTSDRLLSDEKPSESKDGKDKDEMPGRIWIVSAEGGEARPLYRTKDDIHSFAWAPDSSAIYVAIQQPLSKDETDAKERDWKDVTRYRTSDRGDVMLRIPIPQPATSAPQPTAVPPTPAASQPALPEGATLIARSPLAIDSIKINPRSGVVAFVTNSVTHRLENPADTEIYSVAPGGAVTQLTHNQGLENNLRWSPDGQRLYFTVVAAAGSVEGPYRDVQGRIYSIAANGSTPQRLGADFDGNWQDYTVLPDNTLLATGTKGTSTQVYRVKGEHAEKLAGVPGTYGGLDAAQHGNALLLTHSGIREPMEVYIASASHLDPAQPLTHFNAHYLDYAQPDWRPYTWKAEDGTTVEGVLIYPPGERDAKHLPMLTLIHGGPADADGDRFGADWYDWATLAAAEGWLVFRPNYRGSAGYGDTFMQQITPHIVSVPGKDILAGVDALVADGTADPSHLVIGGYSYGGYMTNWLITQTTRFRAAVTGAGAVEHAANWGNDDETYDDAAYLGGRPWEKPDIYQSEAALFQMNKVTTPTHIIAGDADIRVAFLEDILLEHALESLNIPHALLTFPGEGHPLSKNPWHGYIALREELKWINQYGDHAPPAP